MGGTPLAWDLLQSGGRQVRAFAWSHLLAVVPLFLSVFSFHLVWPRGVKVFSPCHLFSPRRLVVRPRGGGHLGVGRGAGPLRGGGALQGGAGHQVETHLGMVGGRRVTRGGGRRGMLGGGRLVTRAGQRQGGAQELQVGA
jgi:hypothetical protein